MTEGDGHTWNWLSHKGNKRNAFVILEVLQLNSYFEKQYHGLNMVKLASSNFSPYSSFKAHKVELFCRHSQQALEENIIPAQQRKSYARNLKKPI